MGQKSGSSPKMSRRAAKAPGITLMTQAELEDRWFAQLKRVKQMLPQLKKGLKNPTAYRDALYKIAEMQSEEYMGVLQNKDAWNGLSFCLRRYLYERFTGRNRNDPPTSWSVEMGDKVYDFSPVRPGEPIPEDEAEDYADLLYRITLENRCFRIEKTGMVDRSEGAITKQEYRNYLAHKGISRGGLFVLSMALKFDVDTMSEFMNALGESPVYNFRDAEECIYYFCHRSTAFHSMEAKNSLLQDYVRLEKKENTEFEIPDLTSGIPQGIDGILEKDYPDEQALRKAFLQYMVALRPQFTGFSRTARELFRRELTEPAVADFSYDDILEPDHWDEENDLLDRKKENKNKTIKLGRDNLGNQLFSMAVHGTKEEQDQPLQLRWRDLDPRISQDLLDGNRLRALLPTLEANAEKGSRKTVTKKDLLLLRFLKLVATVQFDQLKEKEHRDLIEEFHASTDRVLAQAGLPLIYLGNPFENMLFVALCSHTPQAFIPRIFELAPRKPGAKTGYKQKTER